MTDTIPDADDIGYCFCSEEMCWCTAIVTFTPEQRDKVLRGEDYEAPCHLCARGNHVMSEVLAMCPSCRTIREEHGGFGPPHFASPRCESGGREHCACDVCF